MFAAGLPFHFPAGGSRTVPRWFDRTPLIPFPFISFRTLCIVTGGVPRHSPRPLPPRQCTAEESALSPLLSTTFAHLRSLSGIHAVRQSQPATLNRSIPPIFPFPLSRFRLPKGTVAPRPLRCHHRFSRLACPLAGQSCRELCRQARCLMDIGYGSCTPPFPVGPE